MQDSKDSYNNSSLAPRVAIGAIFKNECPYILEWIAHYRSMGITRFYIADNISDDGSTELLIELDRAGIIKRIEFPTTGGIAPQLPAYNLILDQFGADVDWMLFVDADEFLIPTDGHSDLTSWFSKIARWDDAGAIAINWCVYGSSGRITHTPGLVTERFDQHASRDFGVNAHYKSMLRCSAVRNFSGNPHHFALDECWRYVNAVGEDLTNRDDAKGLSSTTIWEPVRINHYVIKSKEEFFLKKRARGRASTLDNRVGRTESFFVGHDRNEVKETLSPPIDSALRGELASLERLLGNRRIGSLPDSDKVEIICDPSIAPAAKVVSAKTVGATLSLKCWCTDRQQLNNAEACFLIVDYGQVVTLELIVSDESNAKETEFTLLGNLQSEILPIGDGLSVAAYGMNTDGSVWNISIPGALELVRSGTSLPNVVLSDSVHRGRPHTPLAGARVYKVSRILASDFQPWKWHLDHPSTSSGLASFQDSVAIIAGWAAHASGPGYQLALRVDGALKLLPFTQRRNDTVQKLALDDGGNANALYGFNQKTVLGDVVEVGLEYQNAISWALRFERIKDGSSNG